MFLTAPPNPQTDVIVTHLRPRRVALLGNRLWVSSEMGSELNYVQQKP